MKEKILYLAILILSAASCSKDKNESDNPNNSNDPVTTIEMSGEFTVTKFYMGGLSLFSADRYLDEFNASERKNITSQKYFLNEPVKQYALLRANMSGTYGLRYVGNCKLIDPIKFYYASGEIAMYALNDSLLGKPVFEIYELATNKVYQRYIASKDSCAVEIYRGALATGDIDTPAYRNVYNAITDTGFTTQKYRVQ